MCHSHVLVYKERVPKMIFSLFLAVGLIGSVVAPGGDLSCFDCHSDHFPSCLSHHHDCHNNEACIVSFVQNHHSIRCAPEHECSNGHNGPQCRDGQTDGCVVCCQTDACVQEQLKKLKAVSSSSSSSHHTHVTGSPTGFGCPHNCHNTDYYQCVKEGQSCHSNEFCSIEFNSHELKGSCKSLNEYSRCVQEAGHHSCPAHYSSQQSHVHCHFCCQDASCPVLEFFHPSTAAPRTTTAATTITKTVPTSTAPATITATATVPATATATATVSLSQQLSANCQDIGTNCAANQSSICKDEAGVKQCAQTCGLCDAINRDYNQTNPCDDQMTGGKCAVYSTNSSMCSNEVAKFVCPTSCGLCDAVITELIQTLLQTQVTTATVTGTQTCADKLVDMSCSSLPNVCSNPLGPVACANYCNMCDKLTTNAVPNMASTETTSSSTTTTTPVPTTTAETCEDTLSDISCSSLPNVCGGTFGPVACRKFCGLCTNFVIVG